MTAELERSADAAERVLAAHPRDKLVGIIQLELAAWTLALAGRPLPALPDTVEDLHARMVWSFASGDDAAALALLEAHATSSHRLLFDACSFAGARCPDALLAIAERHDGIVFDGASLAGTSTPERLLALTDNVWYGSNAVSTVAELVIRGRDHGAPFAPAEERWVRLTTPGVGPRYQGGLRAGMLRLAAREDLDAAVALVGRFARGFGYDAQNAGTVAVLARLVRVAPDRACALVASVPEPSDRIMWLESLVGDLELTKPAETIADELLARKKLDDAAALARVLITARQAERTERALAKTAGDSAFLIAVIVAPGVARLRDAGLAVEAEAARNRVLRVIDKQKGVAGARDLFDVLSAPGLPALMPWGRELP